MVSFNPEKNIQISLSKAEQKLIMEHCQCLNVDILRKVSLSVNGTFFLTQNEAISLVERIGCVMHQISNPTANALFDKLTGILMQNSPLDHDDYPKIRAESEVMGELNTLFTDMYDNLNNTPDPQMGNLSPAQVHQLIYTPWGADDCPIRFNRNLPLETVNQSKTFKNARLLLQRLIECRDEATATAKGNLNRKFVKSIFDKMAINERDRSFILKFNKVINETDVRDLFVTRIVCECAVLIKKHKDKFLVPNKKQHLVLAEKAGDLYFEVMMGYLRKYNLGFADRLEDFEGIQDTFGFTLYQVSKKCQTPKPLEELYRILFLPAVYEEIRQARRDVRDMLFLLELRVIRPLENLGLLEVVRKKDKYLDRIETVKKTPLFDQLIKFNL